MTWAGCFTAPLRDVIQPFPTFSEVYVDALHALHGQITASRQPVGSTPA